VDIPITSAILAAVTNPDDPSPESLPHLNAYCPTLGCDYPTFESLAVCSTCETEEVDISDFLCTISTAWSNCTDVDEMYTCPQPKPQEGFYSWESAHENVREIIHNAGKLWLNAICEYKTKDTDAPLGLQLRVNKQMEPEEGEVYNGRLQHAVSVLLPHTTGRDQMDAVTVMQRAITDENSSTTTNVMPDSGRGGAIPEANYLLFCNSIPPFQAWRQILDSRCFTSTTDLGKWADNSEESIKRLGQITGTITRCNLEFCARKYERVSFGDGQLWGHESKPLQLFRSEESYDEESSEANNTRKHCLEGEDSCPYSWNESSLRELARSITAGLGSYQSIIALHMPVSGPPGPDKFSRIFSGIAQGTSKVFQSPLNPAATNITGVAEGHEIFVKVRWVWFSLPLVVALVGIVFLLATVIQSSGEAQLFKNSILAAFLFGLDGWAVDERRVGGMNGRQTEQDVLRVSRGMIGVISSDDQGDLKLKRQ
jgi:hypothetical protein